MVMFSVCPIFWVYKQKSEFPLTVKQCNAITAWTTITEVNLTKSKSIKYTFNEINYNENAIQYYLNRIFMFR